MPKRRKIYERKEKKKKNCTNINTWFLFLLDFWVHIDTKFFEETIFNHIIIFSFIFPQIYFCIEQFQYAHMFRIVILHSLWWIAYSNSAVQLYIITLVWYVKMERLMVKDVAIVRNGLRSIYWRKRRAIDVVEIILFYSSNCWNKKSYNYFETN